MSLEELAAEAHFLILCIHIFCLGIIRDVSFDNCKLYHPTDVKYSIIYLARII